jgi:tRNA-modifying protein YgfZ
MLQPREFNALAAHVGLADRSDRGRIEINGPDRAKFLHNLTTNEIKRLAAGHGCEAFVTSPQGKTIGYLIVLAAEDRILARSDPGGGEAVLAHLQKYGVFEDVAIGDSSAATFEFHVAGQEAASLLRRAGAQLPEAADYEHGMTELESCPVRVVRESPTLLPGYTIIGEHDSADTVREVLLWHGRDPGLTVIDPESFEVLRIEAGTPVYGKDITEKNLPQEIGRDARAISFVKGCYLGQETVARLDALGHVNQILRGLRFHEPSPAPEPGAPLEDQGKRVGVVTSAAFSPILGVHLALGLVRTTHAAAGTRLFAKLKDGTSSTSGTVSDLPFSIRT